MKTNDFYEVNGYEWFIPVDLVEENKCTKELEVVATESGRTTFVPTMYKFLKPQEPQKPVVPQFVAEWIESKKEYFSDSSAIYMYDNLTLDNNGGYYHDVWLWAIAHHHDFIKAWHDGYDVEKEPLYQIFMKNTTNHKNQIQQLVKQGNKWFFCGNDVHRFKTKFTKGQIEAAGFGWVFDCKGVKVKEVE